MEAAEDRRWRRLHGFVARSPRPAFGQSVADGESALCVLSVLDQEALRLRPGSEEGFSRLLGFSGGFEGADMDVASIAPSDGGELALTEIDAFGKRHAPLIH
jgi:hypothetical protein